MTDTHLSSTPHSPARLHPAEPEAEHHLDPSVNIFAMWIFLTTEIMFFGALFAGYLVYRWLYPQAFAEASQHLNVPLGSINTVILLTSSFTMALGVHAAQTNRRGRLNIFLLATIVLGVVFLGLKGVEYAAEFRENLFPGPNFVFEGEWGRQAMLFFSLYFIMTGLHAVHMIIGLAMLLILVVMNLLFRRRPVNYIPVELVGLFWHFIDIVWIFIFPLMYLIHPLL